MPERRFAPPPPVQNASVAMACRGSPLEYFHPRERGVVNLRPAGSVGEFCVTGSVPAPAGPLRLPACLADLRRSPAASPRVICPILRSTCRPLTRRARPARCHPSSTGGRGFRSSELTGLIEEAQRVNLDIAAAAARLVQADASARIAGAPLLPSLTGTGSESISRASGATSSSTSASVLRRQIRTYTASLSASYEIDFWGKNRDAALAADETATANRFDRDVVALATYVSIADTYFTVLATQDRIRIASNNIASAQRIYDAIKQRVSVGTVTDLELAQQESTLDLLKASVPPRRQTLAQSVNAPRRADLALARERPHPRRWLGSSRAAKGDAGPAVAAVDAAAGHPSSGSAAGVGDGQCRQRPRAILSEHSADRAGRLPECGAGGAVHAAGDLLQRRRQPDGSRSSMA